MEDLARSTTQQMARQLREYLGAVSASFEEAPSSMQSRHPEIKTKAIDIAKQALKKHPDVLGTGVAAAFVPFAVVQFQDEVMRAAEHWEESQTKREFLSAYWRIMGGAWNRTGDTQQWGFPFRDCGPLRDRWMWPYTATMQVGKLKLVTALFLPADSDPCTEDERLASAIYGRKRWHTCNSATEVCSVVEEEGRRSLIVRTETFACDCRPGFVREDPNNTSSESPTSRNYAASPSSAVAMGECVPSSNSTISNLVGGGGEQKSNLELFQATDLEAAGDVTALSLESLMNATIGAILGSCIVTSMGLGMVVYRKRKLKTIAMGMWTILETIILGIVIMYGAVLLHFFEASTLRCLLEPWLRELGFVICYGAVTLKLYRHLVEFRTRKAHRCVVRDLDLLKYLCAMVVAVLCYLSAFTASSMDFVEHSQLMDGLRGERNLCRPLKWDYVTEAGEMAILLFGLYLSYISRNAKTMFQVG